MRKKTRRINEGGLTLVEVVVALTITALMLGILLSALRLGHRSQEKGAEREEVSQRMRVISDRIGWLVRGAYPLMVKKEERQVVVFSGSADRLGLVTSSVDGYSGSLENLPGLKWVSVYRDGEGLKFREKLFYLEDVSEDSGGVEYLFDPTVKGLAFRYLDGGAEGPEDTWISSWEEKDYLPSAVWVSVELDYKGRRVRMPPIVASVKAGWAGGQTKGLPGAPP